MARQTWVYYEGEMIPKDEYLQKESFVRGQAPMVMNDIQPYKSMVDGSIINSRSVHRTHLRDHGCIEIGNEKLAPQMPMTPPKGLRDEIAKAVYNRL